MNAPVGKIVREIRAALQADGGTWPVTVRGGRRFEGDATHAGDDLPLILVRVNSRVRRAGSAAWRLVIVSYDSDPRLAMDLDARVSDALHGKAARFTLGGVGVYHSTEETGGQAGEDPDTGWSSVTSIFVVHGSTAIP